jgi:hypothetical protein
MEKWKHNENVSTEMEFLGRKRKRNRDRNRDTGTKCPFPTKDMYNDNILGVPHRINAEVEDREC